MDKLDAFLDNLQNEIFEEARQALGEKGFHRWRNPKFGGRMEDPDELTDITDEKVLETIGRLPEKDQHCAGLAARTVQEALSDYMIRQRDSK
jgi:nitrogen fixation NifU-like protein